MRPTRKQACYTEVLDVGGANIGSFFVLTVC